uniref:PIPK domain-containing protein n=1 Tax=Octactis speculum TaxID=3111310 RepID=A0A7S2ANB0_9STRA
MVHDTKRDFESEHLDWVRDHSAELVSKYNMLREASPDTQSSSLGEMPFSDFTKWADKERCAYRSQDAMNISEGLRSYVLDGKSMDLIVGDEVYYIGIIDYIVPYDTAKASEHLLKTAIGQVGHSVVPADQYAERFLDSAKKIFKHATLLEPDEGYIPEDETSSLREAVDEHDPAVFNKHPSLLTERSSGRG